MSIYQILIYGTVLASPSHHEKIDRKNKSSDMGEDGSAQAVDRAQSEWEALLRSPTSDKLSNSISQITNSPHQTPNEGIKRSTKAHIRSVNSRYGKLKPSTINNII